MSAVDKLCVMLIVFIAAMMFFALYLIDQLRDAQLEIIRLKAVPVVVKECLPLDIACPGWFFHADLIESRRRMCGK